MPLAFEERYCCSVLIHLCMILTYLLIYNLVIPSSGFRHPQKHGCVASYADYMKTVVEGI